MEMVPKLLMVLVLVLIVVFAVFSVVSGVIGNQGEGLLDQGKNVGEGLGCVFKNKDSASEECLKDSSDSGGGSGG